MRARPSSSLHFESQATAAQTSLDSIKFGCRTIPRAPWLPQIPEDLVEKRLWACFSHDFDTYGLVQVRRWSTSTHMTRSWDSWVRHMHSSAAKHHVAQSQRRGTRLAARSGMMGAGDEFWFAFNPHSQPSNGHRQRMCPRWTSSTLYPSCMIHHTSAPAMFLHVNLSLYSQVPVLNLPVNQKVDSNCDEHVS